MKKLSVFFIASLLALTSTIYLYYNHWRSAQQVGETLLYIPKSAALVYEVSNFGKEWEKFQQTAIAQTCNEVPAYVAIQQNLKFIKDLIGASQCLNEVPLTVSVHGLDEEQFSYIFYFNTHNAATRSFLEAIIAKAKQDQAYNTTVRKYAGYELTELRKDGTTQPIFYIKHDQYVIASFSSLLIEDVVRGLANKQLASFINFKKGTNAQGSLYVNFGQLSQLLRAFVSHGQADTFHVALSNFSLASHLNLKLTQHHLLLSGSAKDQGASSQYFTHTLVGQTAGALLLAPYLPQNTAILQHFTFSDAEQLCAEFQQYRSSSRVSIPPEIKNSNLPTDTLYSLLQGEIGHCVLASRHDQPEEQLVFIKVKNTQTFIEALEGANLLTLSSSQAMYQPTHKTYKLTKAYFDYWLPGQLFPKFDAKYITQIDDYIILANSLVGLQTWHVQYLQGKTWTHTPQQNTWLDNALDRAQFSLFIDLQKVWPQVLHVLKPAWQQTFKTHADALQKFRHISFQLLHEQNEGCYISILLNHKEQSPPNEYQPQQVIEESQQDASSTKALCASTLFQTEAPIINRPWLVKSHRSKGHHILLQDALYQLYFIDPTGKLLWKKSLEGPISTDLLEVDYYNNNKTQYLFATDNQVHLIDYYGHSIGKYPHPLHLSQQPIYLNVVDYNHNKDYRFLIATAQGDIYLKDKHYRPLPAWNPRALGQGFVDTPSHIRVQGKDYFLALQKNGSLQALNRQGKDYPGFPVELNTPVHNPLLVHKGKTAEDTTLIVLTDIGQYISLNLAGHIQKVVHLDRSEDTSRFILCSNHVKDHDTYVIIRHDTDKIAVLDKARNLLFELQHQTKHVLLQYYDFGGSYQFYVLTKTDEQLTYLYDHKGEFLHTTPWENGHEVSLLFSKTENQLQIYVGSNKSILKYILRTQDISMK